MTVKVLLKSAVIFMVSGWFFICQVFPSSEARNVSDLGQWLVVASAAASSAQVK